MMIFPASGRGNTEGDDATEDRLRYSQAVRSASDGFIHAGVRAGGQNPHLVTLVKAHPAIVLL